MQTPEKCPKCDMDQAPGAYFCWHCEYRFDFPEGSQPVSVGSSAWLGVVPAGNGDPYMTTSQPPNEKLTD